MLPVLRRIPLFVSLLCFSYIASATTLVLQPRVKISTPSLSLNQPVENWLKIHPVIRVGVWGPSQPPISEGTERGQFQGIAADYLNIVQDSLQVQFELVYFNDAREAFEAIEKQDIQVVAVWNSALWPYQKISATSPWLLDEAILLTRTATVSRRGPLRSIGIIAGSTVESLQQRYPEARISTFQQYSSVLNAINLGQLDAAWLNRTTANYLQKYLQLDGFSQEKSDLQPDLNLSFGVDRNLPLLREAIDSVLQQLTLDNRLRIASGWGLEARGVITGNPLGLTAKEELWLKSKKQIDILIDKQTAPESFIDNQGRTRGFISDLFSKISQRYSLNFAIHMFSNEQEFTELKKHYSDALVVDHWQQEKISSAVQSPISLYTSPTVVLMDSRITRPVSFDQLKGERLAISRSNPIISWLETWYPTITLVTTDSHEQAITLLDEKKVRGIIAPQFIANDIVFNRNGKLRIAVTLPSPPVDLVVTSEHPDNVALEISRKAINDLNPADIIYLVASWQQLALRDQKNTTSQILYYVILALVLVAISTMSAIWIRRLYRALRQGEKLQKSLSNQLRFTQTLIDNIPVAIYARDLSGRLIHFNPSWSQTIGRSGKEMSGTDILAIESMELSARHQLDQKYQQVLESGQAVYWADNFKFDGVSRYLSGWTVPWFDNENQVGGLIGGWLDLTEKESLIANLKKAKEELERARKSKATFMQNMSHEIRTPLNAIIGLLEIELQRPENKRNTNLQLVWEASSNLQYLFGDVFDIFRAHNPSFKGMMRHVDLPQLIHNTVALYQHQASEKKITIEMGSDVKNKYYKLDTLLLIRLFSSLLRNAIKHGSGKKISVALYQGRQEPDERVVPLVIEVSNEGEFLNVKSGESERDEHWRETGFSLLACSRMAEQNGMELSIESDSEDGTTIILYFNAEPSAQNQPLSIDNPGPELTVVIADDYSPGRRALRQQLTSWGHKVFDAENGKEALNIIQSHPEVDLLITDCTMPVMDGFLLTQTLRKYEAAMNLPPLPVFGLTALPGNEAEADCRAAGMNECLLKPLQAQLLQHTLQRYFSSLRVRNVPNKVLQTPELLKELIEVNQKDIQALQDLISEKNRCEIGRLAHRIRGGANLAGDELLITVCRELEVACETERAWNDILRIASDLMDNVDRFNAEIARQLCT